MESLGRPLFTFHGAATDAEPLWWLVGQIKGTKRGEKNTGERIK